jgi:hypothetical protein
MRTRLGVLLLVSLAACGGRSVVYEYFTTGGAASSASAGLGSFGSDDGGASSGGSGGAASAGASSLAGAAGNAANGGIGGEATDADLQRFRNTGHICIADSCADHRQDDQETDVDCGGPVCPACAVGRKCLTSFDCQGGHFCAAGTPRVCQ